MTSPIDRPSPDAWSRRPSRHLGRKTAGALAAMLGLLLTYAAPAPAADFGRPSLEPSPSLAFEPNQGQAAPGVEYLARTGDSTLLLERSGVTHALATAEDGTRDAVAEGRQLIAGLRFVGASAQSQLVPGPRRNHAVNYFLGNDPSQWLTGVPTYDGVSYRELYPGVDLRYDGHTQGLHGTYVVGADGDPYAIRWRYADVRAADLDADGSLHLRVAPSVHADDSLTMTVPAPLAWQDVDGSRRGVDVEFAVRADGSVGFAIGAYDASRPLTIGPGGSAMSTGEEPSSPACPEGGSCSAWSTFLGSGVGIGPHRTQVGTDRDGNVYVAGNTACPGCFPTVNAVQSTYPTSAPYIMMFVSKLDPTGSTLLYSTYFGGPEGAALRDLAVTPDGTVYLAGDTPSGEYPVTPDAYQSTFGGGNVYGDGVLTTLSPDGQQLLYSSYLGGTGEDGLWGIDVDDAGNVAAIGWSTRVVPEPLNAVTPVGYPATLGAYQVMSRSPVVTDYDAVVTRLAADGSTLAWSTALGGDAPDFGHDVALDQAGNVHVVGITYSSDFPATVDAPQPTHASPDGPDAFVTVLDWDGGDVVRSTFLGGAGQENQVGITVDADGAAYVAGTTNSTDFPTTPNAYLAAPGGGTDAVVTKIDAAGAIVYGTYLGGSDDDGSGPGMVVVDGVGRAYITGTTGSSDFPVTAGAAQSAYAGGSADAFVTVLGPTGQSLVSSSFLGGRQPIDAPCSCPAGTADAMDSGRGLAMTYSGDVLVAGTTNAPDFPTTPGSYKPTFTGTPSRWAKDRSEVFVARLQMTE